MSYAPAKSPQQLGSERRLPSREVPTGLCGLTPRNTPRLPGGKPSHRLKQLSLAVAWLCGPSCVTLLWWLPVFGLYFLFLILYTLCKRGGGAGDVCGVFPETVLWLCELTRTRTHREEAEGET